MVVRPPSLRGTSDIMAAGSLDDLPSLLTSGIACLRQGISLVEIVHGTEWSDFQQSGNGEACQPDPTLGLGRILYANPHMEQMTGLSLAELQAGGLAALFGPGSSPTDMAALHTALHSHTATTVKVLCYKQGSPSDAGSGPTLTPWSSAISVTPINQLPFTSAAWVPPHGVSVCNTPSGGPSGNHSQRSSHEMSGIATAHQSSLFRTNSGPVQNHSGALADAMYRLTHTQPHTAQPSPHPNGNGYPQSNGSSNSLQGMAATAAANSGSFAQYAPTAGSDTGSHRTGGGTITQYLCIHDDISARMSEEMSWRLRDHALSSCSEGITIADPSLPDAPLVYVNDAFLQITGYSREDVMGRNCRFLQGVDTSREAVATLKEAVAARRKATVELLNYKKTGEAFWNRLSITPVFNELGDLVSYIGVQSDVTELIRRKEEERKLMEAKVAAETATEAKSMFLANMSHEIRTPLNGMMATAQLLLASCLTPEQRELAETILESGNSLLGILGDILDFSKLDHGAVHLTREPLCLRRSIEACIEIVAPDALKKGLALYYTSDDDAMSNLLMGDAIRLRQVLTNLLSNAVKFTEHGEVHVDVRVEPLPAHQPCLCHQGAEDEDCTAPHHATSGPLPDVACPATPRTTPNGSASQQAGTHACPAAPSGAAEAEVASMPNPATVRTQMTLHERLLAGEASVTSAPPTPGLAEAAGASGANGEEAWAFRRRSLEDRGGRGGRGAGLSRAGEDATAGATADAAAAGPGGAQPPPPLALPAAAAGAVGGQRRVRISVRDTGIGIPGNLAGSLFQCFKQGSESMARRYGGTGLGLAISKRLSELMEGTVWVESEGRGKGCTFHFCIPADFFQPNHQGATTADGFPSLPAESPQPVPVQPGSPLDATAPLAGLASIEQEPPPAPAEDGDLWSGIRPGAAPEGVAASYASSTASNSSAAGNSIMVSQGQFNVLSPDEHLVLEGRRVLVDVTHPGLAQQISQSCKQLGMLPCIREQSTTPAADPSAAPPGEQQDMLVVSTDIATAALRAGWKGRPVVTVGSRQLLTANLHPLVVMVPEPVLHARLANALVKSTVLLKWAPGNRTSGPKLTPHPISPAQLADFKSWRDRGHGASLSATLLTHQQQPQSLHPQQSRGHYVGGQLAVSGVPAMMAAQQLHSQGGDGFLGGFARPYSYDLSALARRSSLDNSSLDRALVQQMLAATQARATAMATGNHQSNGTGASGAAGGGGTGVGAAPHSNGTSGSGGTGAAGGRAQASSGGMPWRAHTAGMNLPKAIPENTVLDADETTRPSPSGYMAPQQQPAAQQPPASTRDMPPQPSTSQQKPHTNGLLSRPAGGPAAAAPSTPPAQGAQGQEPQNPLRILIAEDNKVNQKVVLKVLQQISGGAVTDVVENGLQVLEALKKKSYDLILMDIHMPEMDGLEATRRIVATYPPHSRPRIIALSADTLQALHDRCREAGIEEFIVKPFRVEDLRRVMQSCARMQQQQQAAAGTAAAAAGVAGGAAAAKGGPQLQQQAGAGAPAGAARLPIACWAMA